MIKKNRNRYITFMLSFAMLLMNLIGFGSTVQVKAQSANNLVVSKVIDKGNVTINVTNSVATSDSVTITLYNKINNNLVFLDQKKLVEGQGSSTTLLNSGTYYGYAKSDSDSSTVAIADFTITGEQPTKSNDATLKAITVNGVALENFVAGTTNYSKVLAAGTTVIPTVIGIVTDTGKANVVVTSATSLPGVTTVLVTAEDGVTTNTYTINFTVAQSPGTGGGETPSDDNGSGGSGNTGSGNNGNINSVPVQVVVDNSSSTPKVIINFESSSIAKDKINEVKPTVSDTVKALELKIKVDNIKGGAGSLALSANKLTMSIPFSIVDLTNAPSGSLLKLEQSANSTDDSIKGIKGVGEVLNFNLALYNNEGTKLSEVHDFAQGKVKINIQLTDAQIKNLNLNKLAALYFNEEKKKWEHVGGSFDAATKSFSFETTHFSKYTIADMSAEPVFDEIAAQKVDQGNFLQFKVNAKSSNNMNLTYTASNLPAGASFDAETQNLNWTPNVDQTGNYKISFNVTDGINTVKKDVTVVVRDVPAVELVEKALAEKDFYHFNIAYYKVVKLSNEKEKAENLDKLATIHDLVWNADIANINKTFENLVATGSGKIYAEVEATIISTNLSAVDKGYLLGELTSWGKKLVFTDEYKAAVDALMYADKAVKENSKDKADAVSKAEAAIAKVTNSYSKEYLLGELANIKD